jgi:hypothetical protein
MTEPTNGIVPNLEAKIRQLEAERAILLASIDRMIEDNERETTMTTNDSHKVLITQLSTMAQRLSADKDQRIAHAGDMLSLALTMLEHSEHMRDRAEKRADHYQAEYDQLMSDVPRIVGDALMAVRRA